MTDLQLFLCENPVSEMTEEVVLSARLAGHPFRIRALTGEEYGDFQNRALKIGRDRSVKFDSRKFNELLCVECTLDPDFRDADSISKLKCKTPEEFLNKVLLPGEIAELASQIAKLSGFNQSLDDLKDEAKN